MSFSIVQPAVAGQLGPATIQDLTVHPPDIKFLDVVLDGWDGDELIEVFPCFVASDRLIRMMKVEGFTGFETQRMTVSVSSTFEELYADTVLPVFLRLVFTGAAGVDDLGLSDDARLVLSDRALNSISDHLHEFQSRSYES